MNKPYLALPPPWLVAHRGGSLLAPENTLAAFELAQDQRADAIETDVRLTRDGAPVVFHDDDTARICGVPGTVEGRTLAELSRLDAGWGFSTDGGRTFPWRGRGVTVPTFRESLERFPAMRFNIDAKTEDSALAEALTGVVTATGALDRVCLGSFFDAQAERLGILLPDVARFLPQEAATCHVMAARSGAPAAGCPAGYDLADLPHRLGDAVIVDAPLVDYFHGLEIPVHVWTVDDEAEMRELLAIGVDGIVTDRPDVLARVLGRRS